MSHAIFNRQSKGQYIGKGNVVSRPQYSSYIRAYSETECNGRVNPEGELRKFDLDGFNHLPSSIRVLVERFTQNQKAILYEFRHWKNRDEKIIDGYILTTAEPECKSLWKVTKGPTYKSRDIIEEMVSVVSNDFAEVA